MTEQESTAVIAKVRALLAKAESTEFPAEAEALSAKAQELISRYALDQLLLEDDGAATAPDVVTAPFQLSPPYVLAKAMIVGAVARANRSRSIVIRETGVCTLVGRAADLEAVTLLASSLLLQAEAAMRRHGPSFDAMGRSRTKSFRQSFLFSYAVRIGERLRSATQDAVDASGPATDLVPVIARHEARVEETLAREFPRTVPLRTSASNSSGWTEGRAAADRAQLRPSRPSITRSG